MLLSLSKSFASSLIFFVVFTKNPTIRHAIRMADKMAMKADRMATFIAKSWDSSIAWTFSINVKVELLALIFKSIDRVTGAAEIGTVSAQMNRITLVIFVFIKDCEFVITLNSEIQRMLMVKKEFDRV